ncbi:ABC transporter ATP-binding protein [Geobacter hydrogenophilus]|nr:ABC transporter ATP-binding protein [Geobacter hydrogenophilus]MBT0895215.1 ABC transporter ATP-binding protein [Geobacter hydrogenophilus]
MNSVISVENLGKKYLVSHQSYTALRDVISDGFRAIGRRLSSPRSNASGIQVEEFWALKDVTFDIKQGERIGVIGRNGAGKSTLLKILSRITEPTEGRVRIRGRVASLLEVGTGFHPELTGRENIFLNGAILGMSRMEIKKKFDEIVDFAEIEKFLDTPVKRYSSGMYVRLAFAVAAHLEPEILIVDEVLAVGDSLFQKKCVDKINDVTSNGNTVILVSHHMGLITSICQSAILLDKGAVVISGDVDLVVQTYLNSTREREIFLNDVSASSGRPFIITGFDIQVDGRSTRNIVAGSRVTFSLQYSMCDVSSYIRFGLHVLDDYGRTICILSPNQQDPDFVHRLTRGGGGISCSMDQLALLPGRYHISIHYSAGGDGLSIALDRICTFDVVEGDVYGTGVIPSEIHGVIFMKGDWRFFKDGSARR